MNPLRRHVLKGGLAAGSLFLSAPFAWVSAQSEGTVKLLRLPKVALVLGNGKYKQAPLKNPANDARAIGEILKELGFDVTLKVDASKADMVAAVQAYVGTLAAKKCVGLFYYAGHGLQLAWKNYMVPVDAVVRTIGDVGKHAVGVNALMEGLSKAGNPMNVVILDACRDNPFGNLKGVDQKGLSQMDAPTHTLLAYATSPGNVASDGDGANGLYTENLLHELKVPEAKIEDVFKRVRLGVRRKSNGGQIPWESTSLEEDFWFRPPAHLRRLSDEEQDKAYQEERALWEKIQRSTEPGPLEDYLRRYPSGRFSELTQLRLEQVLARLGETKVKIESQAGNPFTKGSAMTNTKSKVGDSYTRTLQDLQTGQERTGTETVTQVSEFEIHLDSGRILDLLGNVVRTHDGNLARGAQTMPLDYSIGKQWTTRFITTFANGKTGATELTLKVATRENITVPTGTFNAFRIEGRGTNTGLLGQMGPGEVELRHWVAPDLLRIPTVLYEDTWRTPDRIVRALRVPLVSYKQL